MSEAKAIFYSIYELHPRAKLGARSGTASRRGALVQVEWPEGFGFADLHPWPELGDPGLDELLERLKADTGLTGLLARTLEFSRIDARARARKQSVFQVLELPESHWLSTDVSALTQEEVNFAASAGFRRIKIKVGRGLREEAEKIRALSVEGFPEPIWRLDFNASVSFSELEGFLDVLGESVRKIDFIEDPIPWQAREWERIRERNGVRLAADREKPDPGSCAFDLRIVKPAIDATPALDSDDVFVVTSYLDHPFGQVCAAYVAATLGVKEICGLLSHNAYEKNDFSEALQTRGPVLLAPEGTGFGFDGLLSKKPWKKLR